MSVPYGSAYEPHPSPGTPEEQLTRLLGRALNSFELPDETILRLGTALAYAGSLHSAHHSAGLHRETYRHTWLLADGSAQTLWELAHNTGPHAPGADEREMQFELYVDDEELRAATARLPLPADNPEFILPITVPMPAPALPTPAYVLDNSADHARRLLRRAENHDRPEPKIAALLRTAFAHRITQAFGRPAPADEPCPGYTLYEHAFLLHDGTEISLWEVEHTFTPDGRHRCEVYTSEETARKAMTHRRAPHTT